MTEPLAIGQFAIVDHEPVERAPCVGLFQGRGPAGDRPELYVLAEGTTVAGEQFAAHVVSAAGQAWAAVDMSLTGSLRRLFAEAERNLNDWNTKSIAQHRVSLGLSAVARRGRQVVLAQAGPSLAFHLKSGSSRIYGPEGEYARAIGEPGPAVNPQLRGLMVEPGDRLLLINTAALELADQDLIGAILSLPADQVLRDLYQRVREARSISVLLLTLSDGSQSGEPEGNNTGEPTIGSDDEYIIGLDTPSPTDAPYQPSLFIAQGGAAVPSSRDVPASLRPRSITEQLPAVESQWLEPLRKASGEHGLVLVDRTSSDEPEPGDEQRERPPGARASDVRARLGARGGESFYRGLQGSGGAVPRPAAPRGQAPPVEALALARRRQASAAAGEDTAMPGLGAGPQLSSGPSLVRKRQEMGGRWRGGGSLGGGSRRTTVPGQPSWLLLSFILLAVVVGIALFVLPSQFRESTDERYARLVREAGDAVASAQDELDPAARREMLTLARASLLEARDLRGEGSEVLRLIEDVTAALTQLDAVVVPVSVEEVTSLEEFGDQPLAISRLAVGDGVVYMLDPAAGLVVAVSTNGGDKSIVFTQDPELGLGSPAAIAAVASEAGGTQVVLLDDARQLWALHLSQAPARLPFAPPENLVVSDMVAADDSLYVLDASARTVYRFAIGSGSATPAPEVVLRSSELARARYLLVDDGIVTVDGDGSVHRFDGGVALRLSQAGIDTPLGAAEPPQATSVPGEIAILDPSQDRVVVISSDGTFVRQYRHDAFAQITALVVSPRGSFVVSAGALRSVVWE